MKKTLKEKFKGNEEIPRDDPWGDRYPTDTDDQVHHPAHYNHGKYEPIDVIHDWGLNFDLGNVVKYIARCDYKGNRLQDLKKARDYLDHEIKSTEDEK